MKIRAQRRTSTALTEINVTPLVDVMLVLLIIFMISAPLIQPGQSGIQVDLPQANASALSETSDPVILVIQRSKQISFSNRLISQDTLGSELQLLSKSKPHTPILIQADRSVPYGYVAQVLAEIKTAGLSQVGLITEPPEHSP